MMILVMPPQKFERMFKKLWSPGCACLTGTDHPVDPTGPWTELFSWSFPQTYPSQGVAAMQLLVIQ